MSSSDEVVKQLATLLCSLNWTLATAESCTGGLIGSACTKRSGSSQWYVGGCVTYSNRLKNHLLGVSNVALESNGAVSLEVAKEMAHGVAKICEAEVSISTTGVAGPDGGTKKKPVGMICIGCHAYGKTHASTFHFQGDRQSIREQTVSTALQMCLDILRGGLDEQ